MQMATPNEAASKLGVARPTIIRWVKNGKLNGQKRNSGWYIDEDSINSLLQPTEHRDKRFGEHGGEHVGEHVGEQGESSKVVELKVEVADLKASLNGKNDLIDQLRDEISHLRRPFWRRLLGR
jgi:excisionase family DNA binding protein